MEIKIKDLRLVYEEEIKKNVKNKKKVFKFEKYKIEYLMDIKKILESGEYNGGKYNIFLVYKPKVRVIMSQSIYDKVINHYVARFILIPNLEKYLNDRNCATRKNMGTTYAINLLKKDIEYFKKYESFYFLKLDISKYFYSIDHDILLELIKNDLSKEEYNLIKVIINSTNKNYVNERINEYESKLNIVLPKYEYNKGLPIGNMTREFSHILFIKITTLYKTNFEIKIC